VWVLLLTVSGLCVVSVAPAQNAQWELIEIPDCPACVITNLHFYTPQDGWAIAYRAGVGEKFRLRTIDSGDTWTLEPIPETQYLIDFHSRFLDARQGWAPADYPDFDVDGVIANHGHLPGDDNSVEGPVRFYETTDGGNSWDLREGTVTGFTALGDSARAKTATRRYFTAIRFLTPTVGVLAGQLWEYREDGQGKPLFMQWRGRAIYTTQDGGDTWHVLLFGDRIDSSNIFRNCFGAYPSPIVDIEALDSRYAWIPALNCTRGDQYLFSTQDSGRSWEALDMGERLTIGKQVRFSTPTEGWSWTGDWITSTTDGGKTWTKNAPGGWGAMFISPQEGWHLRGAHDIVGGIPLWRQEIYHTVDSGLTWQLEYHAEQDVAIKEIKYDMATRAIWAYGPRALMQRQGTLTGVDPRGKLPTTWGALKTQKGE